MWRVHRLDQINALKPANQLDFKSLTLRAKGKQIGRFKTVIRLEEVQAISHIWDKAEERSSPVRWGRMANETIQDRRSTERVTN